MPLIKYNNQSLSALTEIPASIPTGKLKLISSQTASNSASISFTSGLNSTYKVYKFVFVNIHPRTDNAIFHFQLSTNGGSTYATTITSTFVEATHDEADTYADIYYDTTKDLAQSTSYQYLASPVGSGADESLSGSLQIFNPASTTYVKHFIGNINMYHASNYTSNFYMAGYGNTTSAVNAIQFKMSSGNFDGTIYLYAIDNS